MSGGPWLVIAAALLGVSLIMYNKLIEKWKMIRSIRFQEYYHQIWANMNCDCNCMWTKGRSHSKKTRPKGLLDPKVKDAPLVLSNSDSTW